MPNKSCTTNLILDKLSIEIEKGNSADVIYTDFPKAFNKVDHKIKLRAYEIEGNEFNWYISFLVERSKNCSMRCNIRFGIFDE